MPRNQETAVQPENVLVAIPTLNEARHVEACIASLTEDAPFMDAVRIVVVDGGSRDGTQEIVERLAVARPGLMLFHNDRRLQSAAINLAVEEGAMPDHRYLVRCDAHAIYPPGFVRKVAETLARHREAASVVSVLDASGTGAFQTASAWVVDTPFGSGGSAHRGGRSSGWVDHGHHAGFRLDWFRQIGGYDPSFSHNEDAEYDHRLARQGGRIWLDADLRIGYVMRPTPKGLMRQYWNYGRGRAQTVLKHRMRPRLRQVIPALNAVLLVAAVAVAPIAPVALTWPAFYAAILVALSLAAAVSLRRPAGLLAGPALAIMHNAWGAGFLWHSGRTLLRRVFKS